MGEKRVFKITTGEVVEQTKEAQAIAKARGLQIVTEENRMFGFSATAWAKQAKKMQETFKEANRASLESMRRMLEREDVQAALKQLGAIMPYSRMISDEMSTDDPIWKYPMHILTSSISAYIDSHNLQDAGADTIETQRKPFVAFIKAYIDECKAIEKTDPQALYSPSVHGQIMTALAEKGLATEAAAEEATQQQPNEALTALAIAEGYSLLRQGPETNSLAKINTKAGDNIIMNPITGVATVKSGSLIVSIENFDALTKGLETSAHQLLDILICHFTQSGGNNPFIQISLKAYMNRRGLKDAKEARAQVKADLETLRNIHLEYADKRGGFFKAYLFGGEMGIKNGIITFSLSMSFFTLLQGYPTMPFPDALFKIDSRHYLHAYSMGRAMSVHKRINAGKTNEGRISVKSLLNACPLLPTYEKQDKSKGAIGRKIIEPFEKNLNHLEDMGILEWAYCHSKGEPITTAEEENWARRGMPYDQFSKLLIQFELKGYPDQTKLITARTRRKKQNAKVDQKKQNKDKKETTSAT